MRKGKAKTGLRAMPVPVSLYLSHSLNQYTGKQSIYTLGKKHYETTDWLGNVRVTYTDKKSWQQSKFALNVSSSQDYYPFGSVMEGRALKTINYRFGYSGHEKIDEVQGSGNVVDMGDRWLDVRLGRTPKLDRRANEFPWESHYSYAGNNLVYFIDIDGEFKYPADKEAEYRKKYPMLTKYMQTQVKQDVMNSTIILNAFSEVTAGNLTKEKVETMVTWGTGPEIRFVDEPTWPIAGGKGHYEVYGNYIELRIDYAEALEKLLASDASEEEKMAAFLPWYKTLLHEAAHSGNWENYEKINEEEVGYELKGRSGEKREFLTHILITCMTRRRL